MSLEHASEDPVLARVNRILELADLPGLTPHQLADPTMRVTERADTEQPHWPRGQRGAVGAQELGRARDPALVVDAAAENDRVVSREVIDVIDGPNVDLGPGFCEPGADSLGDTSSGSRARSRRRQERARPRSRPRAYASSRMMTDIRGASNAKASRELAWNPAHPNWREGSRGRLQRGHHCADDDRTRGSADLGPGCTRAVVAPDTLAARREAEHRLNPPRSWVLPGQPEAAAPSWQARQRSMPVACRCQVARSCCSPGPPVMKAPVQRVHTTGWTPLS